MSSTQIRGLSITHATLDEWGIDPFMGLTSFAAFQMKRLGKKHYVFGVPSSSNWGSLQVVARYKCSHPEAIRRFKLLLITRRLLA